MRPHSLVFPLVAATLLAGCGQRYDVGNLDAKGLAEAIQAANAHPGEDVIHLAPGGLYTLSTAPRDATSLLPPITDDLRIEGHGAEIRRYMDGQRALLVVERGADVRLHGVALSEGSDGAIRNFGTLRLDAVKVTDSTGARTPAIVLNYGVLEARDSEIAYNLLPTSRRDSGTVLNYGELRLRNTAIHDNLAQRRHEGLAVAGAVLNLGTLEARQARIADNEATDGEAPDELTFAAVINLGNGRVEGDLPASMVREAGMVAVAQR